jgi:phosphoribosylamine--glycine ligase
MKALVIGSGGREHAILWALRRTSEIPLELYCAPGNAGISTVANCVSISASDHVALINFARDHHIDLTIVGPEGPLAAGIVDEFQTAGLRIMGPNRAASRLEASKSFAKEFMRRHSIPTADYVIANSLSEGIDALNSGRFGTADSPVVIKADGLAAGKGVIVASSRAAGEKAVRDLTAGAIVDAAAAEQFLIEEALTGTEVSVLVFSDGVNYAVMPAARDHKRVGDDDTGPNTGGMGAITDSSVIDEKTLKHIIKAIVEPTLKGAMKEGFPFKGILFVGLMLTNDGPKVLEYNVRFGDPETQAILIRLKSDLFQIFDAIVAGTIDGRNVKWAAGSSACVVLASGGYPGKYQTGAHIAGLKEFVDSDTLQVFHAGTSRNESGGYVTAGGRVLGVTAAEPTLERALARCYDSIENINWADMHYRRDIGRFK